MANDHGRDRRVQRRIAVGLPLLVRGTDAAGMRFEDTAQSYDVSRTGASFSSTREIAPGTTLEIVIPRFSAARQSNDDFSTLAQVVSVRNGEKEGESVIGVQFLGPRLHRVFVSEKTTESE